MRIAYLVNQYPKTSHSFIRREIAALERLGLQVDRIAIRGWDGDLVDPADRAERKRTRYVLQDGIGPLLKALIAMAATRPLKFVSALCVAMATGWRGDRPFPTHLVYLAEACRIVPWLDAASVRHVHAHFGTNSAAVAMFVGLLGGPTWSFTVHGPEEFDKPEFIALPEKIRRASFVVAVSSFGQSQLLRWTEHRHWHKINVVRCGLDTESFADPPPILPGNRRFVCVGRLTAQKGQMLLLDAAARLSSQGIDCEFVLAGDGEMRPDIDRLIAAHDLQSKVRVTGWIDGHGVREEISGARALVLPSFAEGLPVALMEAMALRRPVITTYVAGIPELVRPGECGWVVPAGDAEAIAHALADCLQTPDHLLRSMGEAAQQTVAARHDVDREAAKLAQLFRHAAHAE